MVIVHIITFAIYLVSVLIYYIFDDLWTDADNLKEENEFYSSRTLSFILMVIVEGVLIFIFWGLSKQWIEFEETESIFEGDEITLLRDETTISEGSVD